MVYNPITKAVRPVSRLNSKGPSLKLDSLKCVDELRKKLLSGLPVPEVAKWLQEEAQEYTTVTRDSLIRVLYRYRSSYVPSTFAKMAPAVMEAQVTLDKRFEDAEKTLDEVEELERLYQLQMERLQIDMHKEREVGKLFPALSNDLRVAMDLLTKRAQLKMDLGLEKRHLGQVDVSDGGLDGLMNRYGKPTVTKVLKNAESRRKVLHVAQNIIAFIGESSGRDALLQQLLQDSEGVQSVIEGAASVHTDTMDAVEEPDSSIGRG